ncbi:MAG: DUF4382 domain-containing protein [Ignavibacteria bacterium]|jgi:hypothetical protein|nr:DUF4382 domain-containing protein [Ignavibacteria bacterium]MCU7498887.1 DUF4382 domain-containing protein [Ignavibacteria bacterium]MCU7520747.1 DUF4382 domain-containing protein [Ignavibacteria bacterium]MCU7523853.1 DUF4382 domain-containing protein [Ignavibacteria bacterium]
MHKIFFVLLFAAAIIAGCKNDDNSTTPQTGSGQLKVYMTDAPAHYSSVNIQVTRVEVHQGSDTSSSAGSWLVVKDSTMNIDLVQLRNGVTALLGNAPLPAGQYSQIRLIIGPGSYVTDENGTRHDLTIPSGSQTGLKLNNSFTLQDGVTYELTLDFDASKSIVVTGNNSYKLKPVIRVEANALTGTISGQVLPLDAAVDVHTIAGQDTITTYPDAQGHFKLMALPEGTYTVHIAHSETGYKDVEQANVKVVKGQNTDIGTITLQK